MVYEGESNIEHFLNLFYSYKIQNRKLHINFLNNLLISKHIFDNGLKVSFCRHFRENRDISRARCARRLQEQCHRQIFHVLILLSKSQMHDKYRTAYREGFPVLFNAFPETFCESGWLYMNGNSHIAK